jgi:hypothetical protein
MAVPGNWLNDQKIKDINFTLSPWSIKKITFNTPILNNRIFMNIDRGDADYFFA